MTIQFLEISPEPVMTTWQAAMVLRTSVKTVRRYLRQGRIKAVKCGRGYRISQKALETFLTDGEDISNGSPKVANDTAGAVAGAQS